MSRLRGILVAGAAAIATAAVLTTTGSAQAPTATTLHLIATSQDNVGFGFNHAPRQGDRFGFGDKITGDAAGYLRGTCTLIGSQGLCTVVVRTNVGTLTAEGFAKDKNTKQPFAVTGGTGSYDGARGTALVTDVNSKTTTIDITLLP